MSQISDRPPFSPLKALSINYVAQAFYLIYSSFSFNFLQLNKYLTPDNDNEYNWSLKSVNEQIKKSKTSFTITVFPIRYISGFIYTENVISRWSLPLPLSQTVTFLDPLPFEHYVLYGRSPCLPVCVAAISIPSKIRIRSVCTAGGFCLLSFQRPNERRHTGNIKSQLLGHECLHDVCLSISHPSHTLHSHPRPTRNSSHCVHTEQDKSIVWSNSLPDRAVTPQCNTSTIAILQQQTKATMQHHVHPKAKTTGATPTYSEGVAAQEWQKQRCRHPYAFPQISEYRKMYIK